MTTATNKTKRKSPHGSWRPGFTLVEMLVVISIIGILMALVIPAIGRTIGKAKETRIKVEVNQIGMAVEDYKNKYGDYPPDFSDALLTARHFRKVFPKMGAIDQTLLGNMMFATLNTPASFTGIQIDRAEAIVLMLGGFSNDPIQPLTGTGGPFQLVNLASGADLTDPANYQYNVTRTNALFDFPTDQLSLSTPDLSTGLSPTNKYGSTDEADLGVATGADILPVYTHSGMIAPYIYFDSRTYGFLPALSDFNGYGTTGVGAVRPYKSEEAVLKVGTAAYGTSAAAVTGFRFANPTTFQVISAGLGNNFGDLSTIGTPATPVYFTYPSGKTFTATATATAPSGLISGGRFDESGINSNIVVNEHLDNITNFNEGTTLEGNLP